MKQSKLLPLLVFAVCFTGLSGLVKGVGLEYYGIEDTINEDLSVHNLITLKFDSPISHLDYQLQFRIHNLTAKGVGFGPVDCTVADRGGTSDISCDITGMTYEKNLLELGFDIRNAVEKKGDRYEFSANYGVSLPIKRTVTTVRLPQKSILAEVIANQSYFPKDGETLTDGRHIMVYWERENLTLGDDLQFMVLYSMPSGREPAYNYIIVFLTLIVIIIMIGMAVYLKRGTKTKSMDVVTSVLNDDERSIVNILNKHEGKCFQKILVRESGFSKAKVSRLVKNLKRRGIIGVEPVSGRENRILLRMPSEK
jgi:uncharacterized membrane protein